MLKLATYPKAQRPRCDEDQSGKPMQVDAQLLDEAVASLPRIDTVFLVPLTTERAEAPTESAF